MQSETIAMQAKMPCQSSLLSRLWALVILAKPGIVVAELLAALAGMLLAASSALPVYATGWGLICIALAAGGAAMINGLLDYDRDMLMPRLACRCLALNRAGRPLVHLVSIVLIFSSLVLSSVFLNLRTTFLLGVAIFSYLFLYTARQKRLSPWGVFVGAVPGALPPLIGAVAVGSPLVLPLLLSTIIYIWQLPHFWFLALRYQDQYHQAEIPVFPLVYGEPLTKKLIIGAAVMLFPCSLLLCQLGNGSRFFALFALLSALSFGVCCYLSTFRRSRFRQGFICSLIYLVLLLLAIITDSAARLP